MERLSVAGQHLLGYLYDQADRGAQKATAQRRFENLFLLGLLEKVAETLDTLASQMEVSKQMCICMATEARDQNGLRTAKELR